MVNTYTYFGACRHGDLIAQLLRDTRRNGRSIETVPSHERGHTIALAALPQASCPSRGMVDLVPINSLGKEAPAWAKETRQCLIFQVDPDIFPLEREQYLRLQEAFAKRLAEFEH